MIIICDNDYDDSNPCVARNVYMGAYMLLHYYAAYIDGYGWDISEFACMGCSMIQSLTD